MVSARRVTIFSLSLTLALLLFLWSRSSAAPDPNAIKVQGPDTVGTPLPVQLQPAGATGSTQTPITASQTGGNQSNVATLAGVAGKTTYITGLSLTAGGSTAGADVTATIAGVISGTVNITFTYPVGAVVPAQPIIIQFSPPIPASASNTAIVVTLPAGGAGNTNASCSAWGFQQ